MSYELRLADCLGDEGLGAIPHDFADVCIADPPFTEHVHAKAVTTSRGKAGSSSVDLGFEAITQRQMEEVADEIARITRRWVVLFCAAEQVGAWIGAITCDGQLEHVRVGAWVKPNAMPQVTGDRPGQGFESLVIAHRKGKKRWNGGGRPAVYSFPVEQQGRVHPTQKPVALMEALVRDYSEPGELILDPYAGSGSTGVAALGLGRRFLGFERDAVHHATALRRLSETREQPSLFAKAPRRRQMGMGL